MKWAPDQCVVLPMFHAFTGCDTVSTCQALEAEARGLHGTPGKPMKMLPGILYLSCMPKFRSHREMATTTGKICGPVVPVARSMRMRQEKSFLLKKVEQLMLFLLHRHQTKRAAYQAGHCWTQAMIGNPEISCPSNWGWSKKAEGGWEVCWTMLPEASEVCRELIYCGCKKGCRGRCKCRIAE